MNELELSISALARRFGVSPHIISNLFYRRVLDDDRCAVINGRRTIPADYVGEIERILRERGHINEDSQEEKL